MLPWTLWDTPLDWIAWAWWQLTEVERVEGLLAEGAALRDAAFVAQATWGSQGLRPAHDDWTRRLRLTGTIADTDMDRALALIARIERGKVLN